MFWRQIWNTSEEHQLNRCENLSSVQQNEALEHIYNHSLISYENTLEYVTLHKNQEGLWGEKMAQFTSLVGIFITSTVGNRVTNDDEAFQNSLGWKLLFFS